MVDEEEPAVVVSPLRATCLAPVATTPAISAVKPVAAAATMRVRRLTRLRFLLRFWISRAWLFTESPAFACRSPDDTKPL
jgi:hypothetical protein